MKLERKRQEKLTLEAQLFWEISGIPASWKKNKTSKVSIELSSQTRDI